jgi:signal transduction histidine kinase
VQVHVADDGRTTGAPAPGGNGGHGLTGMRERAAMLGGTLRAVPREHGGFEVTAELPLEGLPQQLRGDRGESSRTTDAD